MITFCRFGLGMLNSTLNAIFDKIRIDAVVFIASFLCRISFKKPPTYENRCVLYKKCNFSQLFKFFDCGAAVSLVANIGLRIRYVRIFSKISAITHFSLYRQSLEAEPAPVPLLASCPAGHDAKGGGNNRKCYCKIYWSKFDSLMSS